MSSGSTVLAIINIGRIWNPPESCLAPFHPQAGLLAALQELNTRSGAALNAILVRDHRIAAIGSTDEILSQVQSKSSSSTPSTGGAAFTTIDCKHRYFVCPGFVDAHVHFLDSGRRVGTGWLDMKGTRSKKEFRSRVTCFIDAQGGPDRMRGSGSWIRGSGWMDAELLSGRGGPISQELPSTAWVDELTEGIPLLLKRNDMHSGLANSAALKLAGIDGSTPDPVGGKIDQLEGPSRVPTGILRERAMNLLDPFLPPTDTDANYTTALDAAQLVLLKEGITQCHHMSSLDYKSVDEIRFLQKADSEGKLWVRLRAATKLAERAEAEKFHREEQTRFKELLRSQSNPRPGLIQTSTVKCFLDGSLGSRTLATIQPLCCRQGMHHSALMMEPPESIKLQALEAADAGLQLCFHAIGDAAVRLCIDIAEEIVGRDREKLPQDGEKEESHLIPCSDRRLRIEHCQNIDPVDVRRMAAVGCIASMQPLQLPGDTADTDALFTPERSALSAYATRTMLNEKVQIAFGSDWMVCYPSVLGTLFVAVKRTEDLQLHPSWHSHQCLTMDEALTASTYGGSYAGFYEASPWNLGRIQLGSIADLTILSSDPTAEISNCHSVQEFSDRCSVRATIVDGLVRFSSLD